MTNPVQLDFSKAVPIDAPAQSQGDPSGVTLDFSKAQSVNSPNNPNSSNSSNPQNQSAQGDTGINGALEKTGEAVGNTIIGTGKGLLSTASGFDDWSRQHLPAFMTSQWFGFGKPADESHVHEMESTHGTAQQVGYGGETLMEFMLGDAELKGLALSEKLARASKAAKVIEDSPMLTRVFNAGVRALRGTAVGATQGALRSGGDTGTTVTSGVVAGAGNAVVPEAADAIKAGVKAAPRVVGAISDALRGAEKVVQPELQGSLRQTLTDVASDHGIKVPNGTAMRDAAEYVGQQIKAQGSAIFKSIDDALGGTKFQTFDEQLSAARRALRNDAGADHDYTGRLIERISDLEDAKANAQQQAIANGIDPKAFEKANAYWRQGSALQDLSAKLRQSTSGLPDNLRNGSKAASTASVEVVSPNRLAPKIHAMRDSGRLTQALGSQARVDDLLRSVESAKARTAAIAANRKTVGKIAVGAATAAGAGGLAGEAIRHSLQ